MSIRINGTRIAGLAEIDDALSGTSVNPVQNKVVKEALDGKADLENGKVPAAQLPSMDSAWGSITGHLSDQTDLADALAAKANLENGKVPSGELPVASVNGLGVVKVGNDALATEGIYLSTSNRVALIIPTTSEIDSRESSNKQRAITTKTLNYAVRSVSPNVTVIPSETTAYNLLDATATTNNHSWQYSHAPAEASQYTLPAVTDTSVAHYIKLTIDFTTVQTYSFLDSQGTAITPLFTPTVSAGDVYEFDCEYSAIKSQWLIVPHKQGAIGDDYVMQSEVGAANGVAGLDANGKINSAKLYLNGNNGISYTGNGENMFVVNATNANIDGRTVTTKPIVPNNLNYAVTAALSDANHITLSTAQQSTAQSVLGVGAVLSGSGAPTTSTVGKVLDRYEDTDTGKTYTCTAVTVDETDPQNPVTTYTWTDDINEKGGTFTGIIKVITHSSGADSYGTIINSQGKISGGYACSVPNSGFGSLAIGYSAQTTGAAVDGAAAIGKGVTSTQASQIVTGKYNVISDGVSLTGGGTANATKNIEELSWSGDHYITGGHQQEVKVIPAATTEYTLTEGVCSHVPSEASTYVLPDILQMIVADGKYFTRNTATDGTGYYGWLNGTTNRYTASATPAVGDNTYTNTALTSGAKAITAIDTRTHECILKVRFSSSVLTYSFEDSAGNAITPLPLAGTIADGSVVAFRCTWESLVNNWVIMPVLIGTYTAPEP